MSNKLGPRTFGHREEMVFLGREISEQRDYSDKIAEAIDQEVHDLIREAHELARKILTENKDKLVLLAEKLVAVETLEGEALEAVFNEATTPALAHEESPARRPAQQPSGPLPESKPVKAPPVPRLIPKQTPASD